MNWFKQLVEEAERDGLPDVAVNTINLRLVLDELLSLQKAATKKPKAEKKDEKKKRYI